MDSPEIAGVVTALRSPLAGDLTPCRRRPTTGESDRPSACMIRAWAWGASSSTS